MGIEPKHQTKLTDVTGVILAGGKSSRMGSNKALLPYRGGRFIEAIHRRLRSRFGEVVLVTNAPEQYAFLPCRMVPDLFPGMGALAGLHAGLAASRTQHIFVVACDMPYLNDTLISTLASLRHTADVVIPESAHGLEPLHALYARECLPHMTAALRDNRRRIVSFFEKVNVCCFDKEKVATIDPEFATFSNINTPADYYALREGERCCRGSAAAALPHAPRSLQAR